MPYKGGLYAIQGGLKQPSSIPNLGLPKAQRSGALTRSCQRGGGEELLGGYLYSPLDVTLWHPLLQNLKTLPRIAGGKT